MDKVQHYEAQLDENLSTFPILKKLEKATSVPKTYMFLGAFVIVFFSLLFDLGGSFFTNLIGWSFPAYYSFQALEEKESKDYSQWISYWCIFGFLTFMEASTTLLNYLIPFYYLVKTAFLLWLLLPSYRGAEYTYRAALRPLYSKFSTIINDLSDPDCPLPSMSDAANSLRASATAAATKLETVASDAKDTVVNQASSVADAAKGAVESATSAIKGDKPSETPASQPAQETEKPTESVAEEKPVEKAPEEPKAEPAHEEKSESAPAEDKKDV